MKTGKVRPLASGGEGPDTTLTDAAAVAFEPGGKPSAPAPPTEERASPNPRMETCYGRYRLGAQLGAGGMGVVYEAYDPDLDRRVALKVIGQSQRTLGAVARDRLLREARAMAKLAHPNIIAIHDVGTVGDEAFVAMELVDGSTLKEWLQTSAPSRDELLDVFLQAGRGLVAAHSIGLVHRDFKPSNVIIGHDGRVRVLDFGLARLVGLTPAMDEPGPTNDSTRSAGSLTRTGAIVGTPSYMAPEQWTGGELDERTDQFSFCVSLYEALYGVRPFEGTSLAELASRVAEGKVAAAPAGHDVPERLHAAILRGLSPSPAGRHASMQALLDELARARGGRAVRRRRRRLIGGAIALLIALVMAAALVARRAGSESPRTALAAANPSRLRIQVADGESPLMARLAEHVAGDAEARRLGIQTRTLLWDTPSVGGTATEHYLEATRRQDLEDYLAALREDAHLVAEPGHEVVLGPEGGGWRTYYVWTRVELDGASIREATVVHEDLTGAPEVRVAWDADGAARLAALTGQNVGRRLVIIIDGVVLWAPVLEGPITGGAFPVAVPGDSPAAREQATAELAHELDPRD